MGTTRQNESQAEDEVVEGGAQAGHGQVHSWGGFPVAEESGEAQGTQQGSQPEDEQRLDTASAGE